MLQSLLSIYNMIVPVYPNSNQIVINTSYKYSRIKSVYVVRMESNSIYPASTFNDENILSIKINDSDAIIDLPVSILEPPTTNLRRENWNALDLFHRAGKVEITTNCNYPIMVVFELDNSNEFQNYFYNYEIIGVNSIQMAAVIGEPEPPYPSVSLKINSFKKLIGLCNCSSVKISESSIYPGFGVTFLMLPNKITGVMSGRRITIVSNNALSIYKSKHVLAYANIGIDGNLIYKDFDCVFWSKMDSIQLNQSFIDVPKCEILSIEYKHPQILYYESPVTNLDTWYQGIIKKYKYE